MEESSRNPRDVSPLLRRGLIALGLTLLVGILVTPATAFGYGTVLPNDSTTNFTPGWSVKRQISGSQPEPLVAQYDYDFISSTNKNASCNADDKADGPVQAFTFLNSAGQRRVQMPVGRTPQNRRMIGKDLHDLRKENDSSVGPSDGFDASEKRVCAGGQNIIFSGAPPPPNPHNWMRFYDADWIDGAYYSPSTAYGPSDPSLRNSGTVYVAGHNEARQTYQVPQYCSHSDFDWLDGQCYLGAVTFKQSVASTCSSAFAGPNAIGACYTRHPSYVPGNPATLSSQLIGTVPYPYEKDWGRVGYEGVSNTMRGVGSESGKYFLLVNVELPTSGTSGGVPVHQKPGICLLRTANLGDPSSWRAWDGHGFNVHPESAVTTNSPDDHLCEPVMTSPRPWSLTYNTYLKKYMALGTATNLDAANPGRGVYYKLSDDLTNWGPLELAFLAPTRSRPPADGDHCTDSVTYPVVIDPNDQAKDWPPPSWPTVTDLAPGPNFERPGFQPDLYFHHQNRVDASGADPCPIAPTEEAPAGVEKAANIGRLPIDLRGQRQATFEQAITDPTWGFDGIEDWISSETGHSSYPQKLGYGERDLTASASEKYLQAQTFGSFSKKPHGTINVKWKNKDEVWYGAAFYLPSSFQTNHGNIEILRWGSSTGNDFGGIGLRTSDHKFHLVRGTGSGLGDDIGNASFNLPTARWVWLEVHQKFGGGSGDSPFNEVFVDGRLVSTSISTNRLSPTNVIDTFGVGYVTDDPSLLPTSAMYIDRVSILGGQRGAYRGTGTDQAPETPTGLTGSGNQTSVIFYSNTVSPTPTGYSFQRRIDGVWIEIGTSTTSPAWLDQYLTCETKYEYRIAAYKEGTFGTNHVESIVSSPLEVTTATCPH